MAKRIKAALKQTMLPTINKQLKKSTIAKINKKKPKK